MTGIHGNSSDDLTLANSLITGNNRENFNPSPSSGGIKVTRSRGVTITSNVVSNNINTKQIWIDESVVGFNISSNRVSSSLIGIDTELSDTGVIANNTVSGGTIGLYIFDTGNVKVFNNSLLGQSTGSIFLSQDARRQAHAGDPGHDPRRPIPDATNPWVVRNIVTANNSFGGYVSGGAWQFYALDKATGISADSMHLTISGNYFVHRDTNSQPSMVGWGGGDNHSITRYETPSALSAAKNSTWTNLQLSGATTTNTIAEARTSSATSSAVPLPADVAQAIGQSAGIRHIGTF
jgi:parallel beta-helix repeat protein